jgi:hypothetical protein
VIFPQHNQKSGTCFKEQLRALRGKIWALRHSPLAIMEALRKNFCKWWFNGKCARKDEIL